jgi:hypothetical protein
LNLSKQYNIHICIQPLKTVFTEHPSWVLLCFSRQQLFFSLTIFFKFVLSYHRQPLGYKVCIICYFTGINIFRWKQKFPSLTDFIAQVSCHFDTTIVSEIREKIFKYLLKIFIWAMILVFTVKRVRFHLFCCQND